MEQILLAYGIPKETVAAITMLYRNTKVKVRSPDGETEYFNIVAGVLQGDMLAPYLFIICLDYVLRTSIDKIRENGFELTKKRSRRYPTKTITDYTDDISILANTPNQAETLLHSLEQAATGIGLYVNAHKTEYMCYNQTGDSSTLDETPFKLVDKFTYGPPHMAVQKQDDQHEHTFSNYVRMQDVVQKTCLRRWTTGKSGERGSGISVLPARHNDDDDIFSNYWKWESFVT